MTNISITSNKNNNTNNPFKILNKKKTVVSCVSAYREYDGKPVFYIDDSRYVRRMEEYEIIRILAMDTVKIDNLTLNKDGKIAYKSIKPSESAPRVIVDTKPGDYNLEELDETNILLVQNCLMVRLSPLKVNGQAEVISALDEEYQQLVGKKYQSIEAVVLAVILTKYKMPPKTRKITTGLYGSYLYNLTSVIMLDKVDDENQYNGISKIYGSQKAMELNKEYNKFAGESIIIPL